MTDILDLIDQATAPVCGWCQTLLAADGVSAYFCDDECQFEWQRLRGEVLVGYREPDDLPQHVFNQHESSSPETTPRIASSFFERLLRENAAAAGRYPGLPRALARPVWQPPRDVVEVRMHRGLFCDSWDFSARPAFPMQIRWFLRGADAEEQEVPVEVVAEAMPIRVVRYDALPPEHRGRETVRHIVRQFTEAAERIRVRQQGAHVGAGLDLGEFTSASSTVGGVFRRFNDGIAPVVRQFQDAGALPVELPTDPRERALTLRRNRNTGPQQRVRAPRTIRPRGCS